MTPKRLRHTVKNYHRTVSVEWSAAVERDAQRIARERGITVHELVAAWASSGVALTLHGSPSETITVSVADDPYPL